MLLFYHKATLYLPWNLLEHNLDQLLILIQEKQYDCVIGIKSGGAIISNYIAQKLNIPCYYIKISSKCNKTFNDSFKKLKPSGDYIVCSGLNKDISDLNVLLVDESVNSGNTLLKSKEYLLPKCKSITMACIQKHSEIDIPELIYLNNDITIIWPWGYDN